MATYTSNYGWTKPSGSDNVDISVLNNNLDDQDSVVHDAFLNMAPPFSESSTYAVDDIVLYDTGLYKCHTAVVTPGSWTGSTNWQVYKLSEGGSGGGGTSDYNPLTNKPQINGVTLIGNKTTSDLGITASGVGAIPSTDKGANGGVAELDSNGKVPSSQLPSYVDDVLSYASQSAFPATGETGKIYIAEDTNKTYRWSGSAYVEISESLALGETSSTAYRGDRGKVAYDHSQTTGNPHGTSASQVMLSDGVTSVEDMFFVPDYAHAVAVTPNTTYSVLNDGYFIASRLFGSGGGTWIKINGLAVMLCNPGSERDMGSCIYPVKKGDTVITSNLDASIARLYFAPYRR